MPSRADERDIGGRTLAGRFGVAAVLLGLLAFALAGAVMLVGNGPAAERGRTDPASPPVAATTRLAFAGDTGTGAGSDVDGTVNAMVEQDRLRSYDAVILLGDLIYPEGDAGAVDARVSEVFAPMTNLGARLVPVLGNHDYMSGDQADILAGLDRDNTWYAEDVGAARIIVLDTERVDDPAQTEWLDDTLALPTSADWTIIAMHRPAYSAGVHGSDPAIQQAWVPLFEKYGVPLVMSGHDHDYQRSVPLRGVTYVVSGGAATLRPTGRESFTAVSASTLHYTDVILEADRLTLRAIDQDGQQFDVVELNR